MVAIISMATIASCSGRTMRGMNLEDRLVHINKLAEAIESYRTIESRGSWKVAIRGDWHKNSFAPVHDPYVKYLRAIHEHRGTAIIIDITSSTTLKQIITKAKNRFIGNSLFFESL